MILTLASEYLFIMRTDLQTIKRFLLKQMQLKCFAFEVKCKDDVHLKSNEDSNDTQDAIRTMDVIATLKVIDHA